MKTPPWIIRVKNKCSSSKLYFKLDYLTLLALIGTALIFALIGLQWLIETFSPKRRFVAK